MQPLVVSGGVIHARSVWDERPKRAVGIRAECSGSRAPRRPVVRRCKRRRPGYAPVTGSRFRRVRAALRTGSIGAGGAFKARAVAVRSDAPSRKPVHRVANALIIHFARTYSDGLAARATTVVASPTTFSKSSWVNGRARSVSQAVSSRCRGCSPLGGERIGEPLA